MREGKAGHCVSFQDEVFLFLVHCGFLFDFDSVIQMVLSFSTLER